MSARGPRIAQWLPAPSSRQVAHAINSDEEVADPGLRQVPEFCSLIDIILVFNCTLRPDMDHGGTSNGDRR